MSVLSPGINTIILQALNTIFTNELITNLAGDPLQLRTLKQEDLQDDPTLTAPYLVYKDTKENGRIKMPKELEHMYGCSEIGGPARFLHKFECKFGSPLATTRDQSRANIDTMEARIVQVLEAYFDLANVVVPGSLVSPDYSRRIEGANELLIDNINTRIYGGEQTFYGEGFIYWHYPVSYYTLLHVNPSL